MWKLEYDKFDANYLYSGKEPEINPEVLLHKLIREELFYETNNKK